MDLLKKARLAAKRVAAKGRVRNSPLDHLQEAKQLKQKPISVRWESITFGKTGLLSFEDADNGGLCVLLLS